MYQQFLEGVLGYIKVLNIVDEERMRRDVDPWMTPYVQQVPVILDGDLCGFLVDETGGEGGWMYEPATDTLREWWDTRPGVTG